MFSLFTKPSKAARPSRRLRKRAESYQTSIPTDIFWYEDAFHDEKPPAYVELHPSQPSVPTQKPQPAVPLYQLPNKSTPSLPLSETPRLELPNDDVSSCYIPWRRSKTPVLYVGQLEAKASFTAHLDSNVDTGSAELLAAQYQALLMSRFSTPCPSERGESMPMLPRTIRKVRKINSLRRLVMIEEESEVAGCERRGSCSDGETLVGSDFALTPTSDKGWSEKNIGIKDGRADGNGNGNGDGVGDVGLQICLDMLTQELGAVLKTQNLAGAGGNNRSGLQVLLLIEAYEGLRRRLMESGGSGVRSDLKRAAQVLDQWLDALHAIYGEVQSKGLGRMQSTETMRWMPVF